MDQLRRETQPPAGTPPSPVPQYWNPDADQYERVQGAHGAPRAILYGPNGQPISSANRLPVEASVTGEVSITGEVSVAGEVSLSEAADISDRPGRQLGEVTLSSTTVEIGGTEYRLLPDGNTLVGKASQRPSASAAVTAIGDGVAYFASDTRILYTSDGSDWGELL